jgi:hypothetical protein
MPTLAIVRGAIDSKHGRHKYMPTCIDGKRIHGSAGPIEGPPKIGLGEKRFGYTQKQEA